MSVVGKSDLGKLRNHNEDAFFIHKKPLITLISDGMGGAPHGEVASKLAIDLFSEKLLATKLWSKEIIYDLVHETNKEIALVATQNSRYHGMGATLVGYLNHKKQSWVVNVGDSRVYGLINSELVQLTEDHTMMNEIIKHVDHPDTQIDQRFKHMLTSVMGMSSGCVVDVKLVDKKYDKILLCSDGLTNLVNHATILQVITSSQSIEAQVSLLIDLANQAGGTDNITVIIIDLRGESDE